MCKLLEDTTVGVELCSSRKSFCTYLLFLLSLRVVVNHQIPSSSVVLGFSGKPHELLHVDAVKR
jgi:hypothetical protein